MRFIRKLLSAASLGATASRPDREDRTRRAAMATWRAQQGAVDVHRFTTLIEERLH